MTRVNRRSPWILTWPAGLLALLVLGMGAAVIAQAVGPGIYEATGDIYPGSAHIVALVLVRLIAVGGAGITAGLAVAALVVGDDGDDGRLGPRGYVLARAARRAALWWACAALVMVFLASADALSRTVGEAVADAAFSEGFALSDGAKSWAVTVVLAVLAAVLLGGVRWVTLGGAALVASAGAMAPRVIGNTGQGLNHDYGTNAQLLHSMATALLLGALAALILLRRRGRGLEEMRPLLVLVSLFGGGVVVAGAIVAALQVRWDEGLARSRGLGESAWSTDYGRLALAQTATGTLLLLGVGILWWALRRAPRGRTVGARAGLGVSLIGVGTVVGTTLGVSTVRLPSPNLLGTQTTAREIYLGYEVSALPTVGDILTAWRPDLLWLVLALAACVVYLRAARYVPGWSRAKTAAWISGWLLQVVLTSSGVAVYAAVAFSLHMTLHLIVNLVVPVLLVWAGPLTVLRRAGERGWGVGLGRWARHIESSRVTRMLTHPVVALSLYVLTLFGLYFTPLFDPLIRYHWGHQWMTAHFLVTGYLFFWPVVGTDRGPAPLSSGGKTVMLFALMPFHAMWGIAVTTTDHLLGGDALYLPLELTDSAGLAADQRLGGILGWLSGEVPLLALLIVVLVRWWRTGGDDTGDDGAAAEVLPALREQRLGAAGGHREGERAGDEGKTPPQQ